jgi:hypothetical protein
LVKRDNSDGVQAVWDFLWDFTTLRETTFEDVEDECEQIIAKVEDFRRYLTGRYTAEVLLK